MGSANFRCLEKKYEKLVFFYFLQNVGQLQENYWVNS